MKQAVLVCVALLATPAARGAFVIDDRSCFEGKEHVFLNFETRGDGSPIGLGFKEARLMPTDEYASFGVRFVSQWGWADIGTPPSPGASLEQAVDAVGSWPTVLGGVGDVLEIEFITPVRSFGIGVVQQGFAEWGPPGEEFASATSAYNADGELLGIVRLWDALIDGQLGNPYAGGKYGDEWKNFRYGFLGLATSEPIAMLEFTNVRDSIFDDLHFSAIPAPGAGAALGLLGLGALMRRRR